MPVAVDHSATSELGVVDRLPRLVVTIGQQIVHVAEIVIRGPRPVVDGQVALVDKKNLIRRPDDSRQLRRRNTPALPSRHPVVDAVAVLIGTLAPVLIRRTTIEILVEKLPL